MTRSVASLHALVLSLALAACGGANSKAEQSADQLEKAADQSDPASAAVLENAADEIRATNNSEALGKPGSAAQVALDKAADASANTTGDTRTGSAATSSPTMPRPSRQAKQHQPGDPVPPPKTQAQ